MDIQRQIEDYIESHPENKRADLQILHRLILQTEPGCKLWFLDGKDNDGRIVSNPSIGYGSYTIRYANGTSREFYRVGMSVNKTGISVYIMGLKDKSYLVQTYGDKIGKGAVSGYCIKFKKLTDINMETLVAAIRYGFESVEAE